MDRLINRPKVFLINFLIVILFVLSFSPVLASGQTDDQIVITLGDNICPEELTVDIALNPTLQFSYKTSQKNIKLNSEWNILDNEGNETSKVTIDENGLASFNEITEEPLILECKLGEDLKAQVNLTVINSNLVQPELIGFSTKYDSLYISNELDSVNLLDNLVPIPENAQLNLEDVRIFFVNPKFKIIDGILYINDLQNEESPIKIVLRSNPEYEVIFDVIIKDAEILEDIEVASNLETAVDQEPVKLNVHFTPEATTDLLGLTLSYESKNPEIASIDAYGNISAHALGSTSIITTVESADKNSIFVKSTNIQIIEQIPVDQISIKENLVELSTAYNGLDRLNLNVELIPENTTQKNITFKTSNSNVAIVSSTGTVKAISPGRATITVIDEQGHRDLVTVNVNNNKIVADYVTIAANSADEFTVIAKNLHYNTAFKTEKNSEKIEKVSCFAFSTDDLSDLNAKVMTNISGSNDWTITLPVNNNNVNNFFTNAGNINVHIYGSQTATETGNLVSTTTYNYVNHGTSKSKLTLTPYVSNLGFITPSVGEGVTAGTIGQNNHMEGIRISSPLNDLGLEYSVYINGIGWSPVTKSGSYAGTMGLSKGIEAIRINLTGENATQYQIQYRIHLLNGDWSDWVTTNTELGNAGSGQLLEAVEAILIKTN